MLDVDAAVGGVRIGPGGSLTFDPAKSRRLSSSGNVVVAGRLTMRPSSAQIVHQIEFVNVDESRFVGGHSAEPLETDVGLWVVTAGVLDAHGTPKTAWTNLTGAANKGDSTINVDAAAGWRVGDEVVITPTEPITVGNHWEHHDRRTITSVSGARIGLDRPLELPAPDGDRPSRRHPSRRGPQPHPQRRDRWHTRGPVARHHAVDDRGPADLPHRAAQHGPSTGRERGPRPLRDPLPRRLRRLAGSVVDGVAVSDSTGHGFASHLSNGVTFRDCIAHDMVDDAFWWDLSLDGGGRDLVPSHDIVYERCVASFVKSGGNSKFNLTGFMMGAGDGNIARGCVATGVEGGAESSAGYNWPSLSRDDNTWTFEGNMAHNVRHSGIYFWQNGKPRTLVSGFTAYHCGQGIFAGVVRQPRLVPRLHHLRLRERRGRDLGVAGEGGRRTPTRRSRTSACTSTRPGSVDFAVRVTKHLARGGRVTEISDSTFRVARVAQIGLPDGGDHPQLYDFVNCTFAGNEFWLVDDVSAETVLRVTNGSTTYTVRPADQPGDPRPEWNAVTTATPDHHPQPAHLVKFRRRRDAETSRVRGFAEQCREILVRELECLRQAVAGRRRDRRGSLAARPADVGEVLGFPRRQPDEVEDPAVRRSGIGEEVLAAHDEQLLAGEVLEPPRQLLGVPARARRRSTAGAQRGRAAGLSARRARSSAQRSCSAETAASKSRSSWPRPTMWW